MSSHPVGSPQFRSDCIAAIKATGYTNLGSFFERYLNGEDFNEASLSSMGYGHPDARNLSEYINHAHDTYYGQALKWE